MRKNFAASAHFPSIHFKLDIGNFPQINDLCRHWQNVHWPFSIRTDLLKVLEYIIEKASKFLQIQDLLEIHTVHTRNFILMYLNAQFLLHQIFIILVGENKLYSSLSLICYNYNNGSLWKLLLTFLYAYLVKLRSCVLPCPPDSGKLHNYQQTMFAFWLHIVLSKVGTPSIWCWDQVTRF